jgi:hypothetical protein
MRIISSAIVALMCSTSAFAQNDMTGKRELQMMQCPSAAPGAATRVRSRARGVELVVTAAGGWQRREIRRRARHQAEVATKRSRGHEEHTGEGTGSGRFGYCPGMLDGTTLAVVDTRDGVRITVTARGADAIAELQQSTRTRLERLTREAVSAKR